MMDPLELRDFKAQQAPELLVQPDSKDRQDFKE
jgi:hypothetical protein